MGQEIERARALLRALTQQGVLSAADAASAYEVWVAEAGAPPFSRFLIDSGRGSAEAIRKVLRLLAVQGLPSPEAYTVERFEDLLIGQLGIESGMLSAKLLRSVRAVQDKKVAEGKLRRLTDLLPRAGFDANMVELLLQHLQEQVLLCRGCLGRYPRKDLSQIKIECPRCGAMIATDELEPSGELELTKLSSDQKKALAKSSEFVIKTYSVTQRQRRTRERESGPPLGPIVAVLVLLVGAGGIGISVLDSDRRRVPVSDRVKDPGGDQDVTTPDEESQTPVRTDPRPTPSSGGGEADGPPSLAKARLLDAEWGADGRFADLLALWRSVKPGSGEDPAEVEAMVSKRVAHFEAMVARVGRAQAGLEALAAGVLTPEQERALRSDLAEAPVDRPPPFAALAEALDRYADLVAQAGARAAAQRLERARQALEGDAADEWPRRSAAAAKGRPLMGVSIDGEYVNGVEVLSLNADGFTIRAPSGERTLTWEEQPVLSLQVFQSVADSSNPADQLTLLQLALFAREPLVVERLAKGLALSAETVEALLAAAPTSAPLVRTNPSTLRLTYPLRWAARDLKPGPGTTAIPGPNGLTLEVAGGDCSVSGSVVPTLERERKQAFRVAAHCRLGSGAKDPFLTLRLLGRGTERAYTARWGARRWSISVRQAKEETVLVSGDLQRGGEARRARLEFTGREVALSLGGIPIGKTSVWMKCTGVNLAVGASAGPLRVEELALEGSLAEGSGERSERAFRQRVETLLQRLRLAQLTGESGPPPLSIELGADWTRWSESVLERLGALKQQAGGETPREALAGLRALRAEAPGLLSALFAEAYVRVRLHDVAAAQQLLREALRARAEFPEARTLLGLTLALSGRPGWEETVDAGLRGRGDSPYGYLARAWSASRPRRDGDPGPEAGVEDLRLGVVLGSGDALAEDVARAIGDGKRLRASLSARAVGAAHLVYAADEALAEQALERLEALLVVFESKLGMARKARRIPVAVLSREAFARWGHGQRGGAVFDRGLGWLLLRGVPAETVERPFAQAAAWASVWRRYGGLPAWLERSLLEFLAEAAVPGRPEALVKALRSGEAWTPEAWAELFAHDRAAMDAQGVDARARCWGLLLTQGTHSVASILNAAERGKALPAPNLDVEAIEAAIVAKAKAIKLAGE